MFNYTLFGIVLNLFYQQIKSKKIKRKKEIIYYTIVLIMYMLFCMICIKHVHFMQLKQKNKVKKTIVTNIDILSPIDNDTGPTHVNRSSNNTHRQCIILLLNNSQLLL